MNLDWPVRDGVQSFVNCERGEQKFWMFFAVFAHVILAVPRKFDAEQT